MNGDTLLVGSIPLTTPAEALEVFGGSLGPHLASLPDGEVGFRQFWITRVHFQVLAIHPDLEVIQPRVYDLSKPTDGGPSALEQIGRASCRERVSSPV